MTLRLVLDTNIILDVFHFNDPSVAPIVQALREGTAQCFTNTACRTELERVLAYTQFKIDTATAEKILGEYAEMAQLYDENDDKKEATVPDLPALPLCRDKDDQKFLELARNVKADLLITKDKALLTLAKKKHRLSGLQIVKAAEATQWLLEQPARS